jgi:hypothetical protein
VERERALSLQVEHLAQRASVSPAHAAAGRCLHPPPPWVTHACWPQSLTSKRRSWRRCQRRRSRRVPSDPWLGAAPSFPNVQLLMSWCLTPRRALQAREAADAMPSQVAALAADVAAYRARVADATNGEWSPPPTWPVSSSGPLTQLRVWPSPSPPCASRSRVASRGRGAADTADGGPPGGPLRQPARHVVQRRCVRVRRGLPCCCLVAVCINCSMFGLVN